MPDGTPPVDSVTTGQYEEAPNQKPLATAEKDTAPKIITLLPDQNNATERVLEVINREDVFLGGEKRKFKIQTEEDRDGLEPQIYYFIQRDFGTETDEIIQIYYAYKQAKLPVVETFRRSNDGMVVMTDITADGSKVYGKATSQSMNHGKPREPSPLDSVFLELIADGSVVKDMHDQALKLAAIAGDHGILLAYDDPFELIIHPDKTWSLVCLDLEQAILHRSPEGTETQTNLKCVDSFGIDLRSVQLVLSKVNTNGIPIASVFARQ